MADFSAELQNWRPSFPLIDIVDHQSNIIEPIHQFTEINQLPVHHNFPPHTFIPSFSTNNDNFFIHQQGPEFPGNLAENFPAIFHHNNNNNNNNNNQYPPIPICQVSATPGNGLEFHESCRKRKAIILDNSESSSMNSSPQDSDVVMIKTKNNSRRGKRAKSSEEAEKPKEVVHVRARRGQATDSHSLAERVRRGKINERLRCLQDIVPGCYKTMGMAVMLDEIINYVQSLQNQVEFLSMKLTAASTFYDFNSETDAIETMQRAKAKEAKEMERRMRGEGSGELSCYNSTWSL